MKIIFWIWIFAVVIIVPLANDGTKQAEQLFAPTATEMVPTQTVIPLPTVEKRSGSQLPARTNLPTSAPAEDGVYWLNDSAHWMVVCVDRLTVHGSPRVDSIVMGQHFRGDDVLVHEWSRGWAMIEVAHWVDGNGLCEVADE